MKKLIAMSVFAICTNVQAFDIVAFGTSATNCRGVDRSQTFPVKLQELLRAKGYDVRVINAGVDGDRPVWMVNRIKTVITPDTKLVIFEPGPNESYKPYALEPIEKVFAYLQDSSMPTLYASNRVVQSDTEAEETARKYNAKYYGHWKRDVPRTREYFQFDTAIGDGHMTAQGCAMWAENIVPTVEKILVDNKIQ